MMHRLWIWISCLGLLPGLTLAETDLTIAPVPPKAPHEMAINLATLADWGVQQPFIDRMKVARPWIGHLPGQWGGVDAEELAATGVLDENGWPTHVPKKVRSIATLVMTDLDEAAMDLAGRYVLRFEGDGIVEVGGRATGVRYGKGQITFDFTPGPGAVEVKIQRSDRKGTGDYVRNITIMRADRVAAYDGGAVFNPDFLEVLQGFAGLRFMGWMSANHTPPARWEMRPRPEDYTYMRGGIPLELVAQLSNTLGADPWVTLPHLADDTYFRNAATLMDAALDPGLAVYVEFSNEVWNWGFEQAHWAAEAAEKRWGTTDAWLQIYAMRAVRMAQIWREVFGADSNRLTTVISSQTAWLGLEENPLEAPLWQAEGNPAPYEFFDAYAVTGYFGGQLGSPEMAETVHGWIQDSAGLAKTRAQAAGLTGAALQNYVDAHRYDHAIALAAANLLDGRVTGTADGTIETYLAEVLPYQKAVADRYDLQLVMYEGGTHVVGHGSAQDDEDLAALFAALNYSDEMGALYSHLMQGWADQTDAPFTHFEDLSTPSRWGSWGNLRHYSDENPRWRVIQQFLKGKGS